MKGDLAIKQSALGWEDLHTQYICSDLQEVEIRHNGANGLRYKRVGPGAHPLITLVVSAL